MHSLNESYKRLTLQSPASVSTTSVTTGVSAEELHDDVMVLLETGAVTGTSITVDIDVQTSDAVAGTYTTVASFTQFTEDDDNKGASLRVYLDGPNSNGEDQSFIRLSYTVSGGSPDATLSITALVRAQEGKEDLNSATLA